MKRNFISKINSTVVLNLIILATVYADGDEVLRPKHEISIFNRTTVYQLAPGEIPDPATDFMQSVVTSLEMLKNDDHKIAPEQLNRFTDGLNQYYLSKAHQHYFDKIQPPTANASFTDPVCMPNTTSEDVEFHRVKVYGFPGFGKNARISFDVDGSSHIKQYTMRYTTTSDVAIISGYFRVDKEQYYFVYHTHNNVYDSLTERIRTRNGILKTKTVSENVTAEKEIFVHTYDSTQERYAAVNSTIYAKFQSLLRDTFMPKLTDFAEGLLKPNYRKADVQFAQAYRQKVLETLIENVDKYMRMRGHLSYEFVPQNSMRNTRPGNTTVFTYQSKVDGYLNYEKFSLNTSQPEGDETTLFMSDVVTLYYPVEGNNTSVFTIVASNEKNVSYEQKFKIKSIDIMIAYKANLSTFPVHVYRNLEKWKFTKTGFYSKIELYNFNSFYQFVVTHTQVELGKLIGSFLNTGL